MRQLTRSYGCAASFCFLFVFSIAASAASPNAKLDATLRLFAEQPYAASRAYADLLRDGGDLLKSGGSRTLPVTLRIADESNLDDAIESIRAEGAIVRSRSGAILTADVPVAALASIAALTAVTQIEASRPVPLRLNVSVAATGATSLRSGTAPNWSGLTGKGVIVGVIDDGVDFRHQDFRNGDGTTRILALWDQRANGPTGTPPAGFSYGGECTPAMLNAAINNTPNQTSCAQPSTGGHGTHVAGIAAGSGRATGNNQPSFRFTGMAPEADLLVANSIGGGINAGNSIVDAIVWMKAKAAAAGKPLVINMSFGSYYGARDGTSNFETALSSAGAAGVVLVAASGNEGNAPIRAEAPISQGSQVAFDLNIPAGKTSVKLESWYPGNNSYSVIAKGPGACVATPTFSADAGGQSESACGLITVSTSLPMPSNDDRQLEVTLSNGASPLTAGAWTVTILGTTVTTPNTPVSIVTGEDAGGMTIVNINGTAFPAGSTTQILTDASTPKRVIGVASYNTNYNWTNSLGNPSAGTPDSGPINDLSNFSSRGPRRLCSNAVKCPMVMKPEITAPGAMIMAAKAGDKKVEAGDDETTERDGVHIALNGTSMASPHVTGAIALLLQKKPTLTPEDVKQLLFANIKKTTFTPTVPTFSAAVDNPAVPNNEWGYGVLDVAKAAAAIPTGNLTLTVARFGSGTGRVSGPQAGIDCGTTCSGTFAAATPFSLTATADAGSVFTGWLGACTGNAGCDINSAASTSVSATFAPGATIPKTDVDANAKYDALSDAVMISRYLSGLTGQALIESAIDATGARTLATDIAQHLINIKPQLDVDGNGQVDAQTDGLLLLRYMFGLRNDALVNGAIGPGATRTTSAQVETYIGSILK